MSTIGLTSVPTEALRTLLRHHHRGELTCPLTPAEITRLGLQDHTVVILREVRDLDSAAVRAVLVCTLAERIEESD